MPVERVLVVGAGAIGLRTALELLRRDVKVVLKSRYGPLHPSTCSMGAGGLWMPFRCDDKRVDRWAKTTFDELYELARSSDNSPVEIVPAVVLKTENSVVGRELQENTLPTWTRDSRLNFQHLTMEMLHWQNSVHNLRIPSLETLHEAGYNYCWHFHAPVVDCPNMLGLMLDEVESHSYTQHVDINMENCSGGFSSLGDMVLAAKEHKCDAVINCTGLGAKELCNDETLIGARGILHLYDRYNEVRALENSRDTAILVDEGMWGSETEPCYIIPRGDKILIGGSYLKGDREATIRKDESERLEKNSHKFGIDSVSLKRDTWIGWRPARDKVNLQIDTSANDVKVVHNYGHGGSGWTTFVGAAREAVNLCLG